MKENKEIKNIALLIDAENISAKFISLIFDELSKYGGVTYKRIYGDWTNPNMQKWKKVMQENALTPIHHFQNTQNKNSSDSALIIDAMDILYSHTVEGFCIVSSDSDFTRLITRIREDGVYVIGMGEVKAPKPLVNVCDKFVYLDVLEESSKDSQEKNQTQDVKKKATSGKETSKTTTQRPTRKKRTLERDKISATMRIIDEFCDDDGYANFAEVINRLSKMFSDMQPNNYGYSKSSDLFADCEDFVMKKNIQGNISHFYIKVNE